MRSKPLTPGQTYSDEISYLSTTINSSRRHHYDLFFLIIIIQKHQTRYDGQIFRISFPSFWKHILLSNKVTCQARFIVRALINSHLDIFPFLLYLALGNKIRLKMKKKKRKKRKNLKKSKVISTGFVYLSFYGNT